jgi:RNAse (barnase) inhibitor barstar
MRKTIPTSDGDFDERQLAIISKAKAMSTVWNLDALWMNNVLDPLREAWVKAWADYRNKDTRTPVITLAKQRARKAFEPALRLLVQMLLHNPNVSVEDLKSMEIVVPMRSNVPAPVTLSWPVALIDTSVLRYLIINFRNKGSKKLAKPPGQHGVELRWGILTAPPTSVDQLLHTDFDTRSPFTLEFDQTQRGQTVYLCMRWENTRGIKGPWGDIVAAVIP